MAIPIEREPEEQWRFAPLERCCFCHMPTPFWTALSARSPGQQVACCESCALVFDVDVVPSKDEWFDYWAAQAREREG